MEAKIANELAITLTPSVSTESIVLLSTAPQTPTPSCHSAPSSGRSTPSVTWSDHVEVFDNNDDGGNNDGNDNVKSVSTLKILAANITLTEYYLIIIIMMMMMTRVAWPPLTVTKL